MPAAEPQPPLAEVTPQERNLGLFLWVLGAIAVLQGLKVVGTIARNVVFLNDRLQGAFAVADLWTLVPVYTTSALLISPLIAAAIVLTRTKPFLAATTHLVLVALTIGVSGTCLFQLCRVQGDKLQQITSAASLEAEPGVDTGFERDSEASTNQPESGEPSAGSRTMWIYIRVPKGLGFWFGEAVSVSMAYLTMLAAGYAALYFRLAFWRSKQSERLAVAMMQLRYDSLCSRLTPHFLFNTLNTISSLTLNNGDAARACISRLGGLLHAAIEALPEREIRLEREIHLLRDYLDIQQTRFGDALEYRVEVQTGLDNALVPAFLLQPLVENCFAHGFHGKESQALVSVRVLRNADRLKVEVSDNGAEFDTTQAFQERYGLGLTRERLSLQYGSEAELVYFENRPRGLVVSVTVPLRFAT